MSQKSPNDTDKFIGSRIKLQRKLLGMSQERLGEILGLTFQQIQKYENGANRISAGRLQVIADALGVPVGFFFEKRPGSCRTLDETRDAEKLLNTREGIEIAQAFMRISSPAMRRALIDMARAAASS